MRWKGNRKIMWRVYQLKICSTCFVMCYMLERGTLQTSSHMSWVNIESLKMEKLITKQFTFWLKKNFSVIWQFDFRSVWKKSEEKFKFNHQSIPSQWLRKKFVIWHPDNNKSSQKVTKNIIIPKKLKSFYKFHSEPLKVEILDRF